MSLVEIAAEPVYFPNPQADAALAQLVEHRIRNAGVLLKTELPQLLGGKAFLLVWD